MNDFFYKKGKFETNKEWSRPNIDSILKFSKDIAENTDILEKYRATLYGGIFYKRLGRTWDIDLNLSGDFKSYEDLENDFLILQQLADSNDLLLDINWTTVPLSSLYGSGATFFNAAEVFKNVSGEFIKIGYARKEVKGEEVLGYNNLEDADVTRAGEFLIIKDLKNLMISGTSHIKWKRANLPAIKNLTIQQILNGEYGCLIDDNNKII